MTIISILVLVIRQIIGWIIVLIGFIFAYIGTWILPPNDKTYLFVMMQTKIEKYKNKIRSKTWIT